MYRKWDAPFRYIVLAALLVFSVALLWYVRTLLQPLLAAALIAYVLSPGADLLMSRFDLRRKSAATIVFFLALAVVLVLVATLVPAMLEQVRSVRNDLQTALADLEAVLSTPIQVGLFRLDLRLLVPSLSVLLYNGPIVPQPVQALRFLEMTSRGVVWAVVIMVIVYYLMTEWDELRGWAIGLAPPTEQADLSRLYDQIRNVWQQYLRGQFRLILILAVLYSAAWTSIGLPGGLALGLMAGLLNLIPEVGPAAIGLLATLIAYLEGSRILTGIPNLFFAVLTLGTYLLINAFKSVWLQPRVLGRSVLLHEGLVFVAIVGALILNGILGVLVVVPVLASALIVAKYLRRRLLGMPPFDEDTAPAPAPITASQGTRTTAQPKSSQGEADLAAPSSPKKNPR